MTPHAGEGTSCIDIYEFTWITGRQWKYVAIIPTKKHVFLRMPDISLAYLVHYMK
jgi:hypothetical protein